MALVSIRTLAASLLDLNVHINHLVLRRCRDLIDYFLKVMQNEKKKHFWVTLMDGGRFKSALIPVT